MRKEINFSKGVRGKYTGQEFIVIGDRNVNTNYSKMLDLLDQKQFKGKTHFFQLSDFFLFIRDLPDEHFHKLTDGKRSKVFVNVYDTNGTKLIDLLVQGYLERTYEIAKKYAESLEGIEIVVSSKDFEQVKDGIDKIIGQNENITFSDFLRLDEKSVFAEKLELIKVGRKKDPSTLEILRMRDDKKMLRNQIIKELLSRKLEELKSIYIGDGLSTNQAEAKAKREIRFSHKYEITIKVKNAFQHHKKKG